MIQRFISREVLSQIDIHLNRIRSLMIPKPKELKTFMVVTIMLEKIILVC